MYESESTAKLDDSGSADSVVVGSADMLLFAIVPYAIMIDLLCSLRFIFFVVRISKNQKHITCHSLTSLISVQMLFWRGNTILNNCIW